MEIQAKVQNNGVSNPLFNLASHPNKVNDQLLSSISGDLDKLINLSGNSIDLGPLKEIYEQLTKLIFEYKRKMVFKEINRKDLFRDILNPREWIAPWYKKKSK